MQKKPNQQGGSYPIKLREYGELAPRSVDASQPARAAQQPVAESNTDALQEAFKRCGMSDTAAAIAARGRSR